MIYILRVRHRIMGQWCSCYQGPFLCTFLADAPSRRLRFWMARPPETYTGKVPDSRYTTVP